jgi:hypothetical protein
MPENTWAWAQYAFFFGGAIGGWTLLIMFAREIWARK